MAQDDFKSRRAKASRRACWSRCAAILLIALAFTACSRQRTRSTARTIELEEPKTTGGILFQEHTAEKPSRWFDRWAEVLEASERRGAPALPEGVAPSDREPSRVRSSAEREAPRPGLPSATGKAWPPETGRIADLPKMSALEVSELLDVVERRLQAEAGYTRADDALARRIPALADDVLEERLLVLRTAETTQVLRFGYWQYLSHPPQLILHEAILSDGELRPVVEATAVELAIDSAAQAIEEAHQSLTTQDLESQILQLSYIDTAGAIAGLKGMGLNVMAKDAAVPQELTLAELPVLVELPAPSMEQTGLVGKQSQVGQGKFGSTVVPTLAGDLTSDVVASPSSRLLVLYHPAYPDQLSRVKTLLDRVIDRPARQIFIEGMVVEVNASTLEELGIEWQYRYDKFDIGLGNLIPGIGADTLFATAADAADFSKDWVAQIRALVSEGRAEILTRPSILTLNDRQASIRVGLDVPIATSQEGLQADASKIAFDFDYLALGILLNVRPRVSEDGREVSLMVDTMVSTRLAGEDLEIRDPDNGQLLASAPTVQSRRVQTYARIQNNTPFIIGGLVAHADLAVEDKVPILGDIPVLGLLFRSTSVEQSRREVIIVLTPYVVPENLHLSRALPPGERMDSDNLELFRDAYAIRPEDIFGAGTLYRNRRFLRYRELARRAVEADYRLAAKEPFSSFAEDRIPADEILVFRILFNAARRLKLADRVAAERVIVLTEHHAGAYKVTRLGDLLRVREVGETYEDFFTENPGEAIVLTFLDPRETPDGESVVSDPVPEIQVVPCEDRRAWTELVWDLNQPDPRQRARFSIVLQSQEDVESLRLAILLKYIRELNGGRREAKLLNFIPGRMIEVPDYRPDMVHPVDAEVAAYFVYSTEHFYAFAAQEIDRKITELDQELRRPEIRRLLPGEELPGGGGE